MDYPVNDRQLIRDCTIGEGTSEIQRLIIARDVIQNGPV